jgi:hypothetical protein
MAEVLQNAYATTNYEDFMEQCRQANDYHYQRSEFMGYLASVLDAVTICAPMMGRIEISYGWIIIAVMCLVTLRRFVVYEGTRCWIVRSEIHHLELELMPFAVRPEATLELVATQKERLNKLVNDPSLYGWQ